MVAVCWRLIFWFDLVVSTDVLALHVRLKPFGQRETEEKRSSRNTTHVRFELSMELFECERHRRGFEQTGGYHTNLLTLRCRCLLYGVPMKGS